VIPTEREKISILRMSVVTFNYVAVLIGLFLDEEKSGCCFSRLISISRQFWFGRTIDYSRFCYIPRKEKRKKKKKKKKKSYVPCCIY
jgi:hypothetical protein